MADWQDWLADGASGGNLREYHHPTAHRLELVEGAQLSPAQLAQRLHRDERSIRNWARASDQALDDMWEADAGGGCFLLLHNPDTREPVTLGSGHRVAIISRPAEGSKPGRPRKGQEWSFALAHPRGPSGGFAIPSWVRS